MLQRIKIKYSIRINALALCVLILCGFFWFFPIDSSTTFIAANSAAQPFRADNSAAIALRSVVSIRCRFSKEGSFHSTAGSGVIYRLDKSEGVAYIITNYHVIFDYKSEQKISDDIRIFVYGEEGQGGIEASFVGGSALHDIAVLRAQGESLSSESFSAIKAGDSNSLFAGDKAIAVGNANGGGISVTGGIISVESEFICMPQLQNPTLTRSPRVIRIDAAVNGGNSGGGLFNNLGELVGIVNAKTVATGIEGICYAIPSSLALPLADIIIDNNSKHCFLGVQIEITASKGVYNSENNCVDIIEELTVCCVDGSGLGAKGFRAGDKLISVSKNGSYAYDLVRSFYLPEFMLGVRAGDNLDFRVHRPQKGEVKFRIKADEGSFIDLA